jgi:hypothetical protein
MKSLGRRAVTQHYYFHEEFTISPLLICANLSDKTFRPKGLAVSQPARDRVELYTAAGRPDLRRRRHRVAGMVAAPGRPATHPTSSLNLQPAAVVQHTWTGRCWSRMTLPLGMAQGRTGRRASKHR